MIKGITLGWGEHAASRIAT